MGNYVLPRTPYPSAAPTVSSIPTWSPAPTPFPTATVPPAGALVFHEPDFETGDPLIRTFQHEENYNVEESWTLACWLKPTDRPVGWIRVFGKGNASGRYSSPPAWGAPAHSDKSHTPLSHLSYLSHLSAPTSVFGCRRILCLRASSSTPRHHTLCRTRRRSFNSAPHTSPFDSTQTPSSSSS